MSALQQSSSPSGQRQVWRTPQAGDLAMLSQQTETLPALAADMVRVEVKAIGLNFADILALTGMYSAAPSGAFIPGLELAGVVADVGASVTGFKLGDRVMGSVRFGAYASVVDVAADRLQPLPAGWSFAEGAAFFVQTFAAWYGIHHLGAGKRGQRALIHSAAGGVGLQAVRICQALGIDVVGTVGSPNKVEFLKAQGVTDVLVREPDFAAQLKRELADKPIHLVLDAIGGKVQEASFKALAPTGRLVVYGATVFAPGERKMRRFHMLLEYLRRPRYDALSMISENRGLLAFNLIWLWEQRDFFDAMIREIAELKLPAPHVGHQFRFDEAPQALELLRSGRSVGKVVLTL